MKKGSFELFFLPWFSPHCSFCDPSILLFICLYLFFFPSGTSRLVSVSFSLTGSSSRQLCPENNSWMLEDSKQQTEKTAKAPEQMRMIGKKEKEGKKTKEKKKREEI